MSRAHVPFLRSAERIVRRRSATRWSGGARVPTLPGMSARAAHCWAASRQTPRTWKMRG